MDKPVEQVKLAPGWMYEQLKQSSWTVRQWPRWMRRESGAHTEASSRDLSSFEATYRYWVTSLSMWMDMNNMAVSELAEKAELPLATVRQVLLREGDPPLSVLVALAKATGHDLLLAFDH